MTKPNGVQERKADLKADLERYASYLLGRAEAPYGQELFMRLAEATRNDASEDELTELVASYDGPHKQLALRDAYLLPFVKAVVLALDADRGEGN